MNENNEMKRHVEGYQNAINTINTYARTSQHSISRDNFKTIKWILVA